MRTSPCSHVGGSGYDLVVTAVDGGNQSRLAIAIAIAAAASASFLLGLSSKRATSTRTVEECTECLATEDRPDTLAACDSSKYRRASPTAT